MTTIDYYNAYAEAFIDATFKVDMERLYQPFLGELFDSARILDVGCGSGRDTLAFINKGYQVDAIDYSKVLVDKVTQLTGVEIALQSFYEIDDIDVYDGIWACASLLHCERGRLSEVIGRLINALKPNGVLYMSFKYGNCDRDKEGRNFTDINEQQSQNLLNQFNNVDELKQWITVDQRPDREEKWLNLLWKKYA